MFLVSNCRTFRKVKYVCSFFVEYLIFSLFSPIVNSLIRIKTGDIASMTIKYFQLIISKPVKS